MGSGHVTRCLTLADALREAGASVSFVCREHVGHSCGLVERRGHRVDRLPAPTAAEPVDLSPAHAGWLGAGWREDAGQTRAAIENTGADWLVIDHYAIERRWEGILRPAVERILVIDDLADRDHDCDVLLDQNLVFHMHSRYLDRVPAGCGLLLGPRYALLQPVYAQLRRQLRPRARRIERVLISFGGADQDNLAGRALAGCLSLNRPELSFDVVVREGSPHRAAVSKLAADHANVRLHGWLPTLAPLMLQSDLAIGAAGATSWERLCLRLPSLIVVMADNQKPIGEELRRRGLAVLLGSVREVTEAAFAAALAETIRTGVDLQGYEGPGEDVDGAGVARVCAAMTVSGSSPLRARPVTQSDAATLLEWANDPATRRNSFNPEPIAWEGHLQWLRSRLQDRENCSFYIIGTAADVPVGQVRFQKELQAWEVHYSLAPVFRGRGLGRPLLECALHAVRSERQVTQICGRVKPDNAASRRLFESLGFDCEPDPRADSLVYRRNYQS
jgi:UDP-2,4-diacetamido-2,4,6-trideoxy-beta-L-altropyranose hydrolase